MKQLPEASEIRALLRITEAVTGEIVLHPDNSKTPTLDKCIPIDSIKLPIASERHVVVRLENCDGEETMIACEGGRNYAVGIMGDDGVIELIDWSYRSAEEARATWLEIDGKPTIEAKRWKEGEPWTPETARRRIGGTMGT